MNQGLMRYARYQARDLALGAGAVMFAVAALITLGVLRLGQGLSSDSGAALLASVVQQTAFFFVLLATTGVASTDRHQGYYRVLFARPVSPQLYYLQRWLLGFVAVVAFVPLMAAGVALRAGAFQPPLWLLGYVSLMYLLAGGLVFLLSTLLRRDWLFVIALYAIQHVLAGIQQQMPVGPMLRGFWRVLPPFHYLQANAPPTTGQLIHIVAYGCALVAAALTVLHLRPMGSGGRA